MSHSPEPGGAGLFLASQQHRLCEQGGCLACLPCPSLSQDGPQPPGTLSQRHAQVPPLWSAEDRQVSVLLRQRAQCGPAPRADAGPCHWLSHKPLPGRLISELPRPRPSQNALLLTVLWHLPGSVLKPLHKLIILHNVAGSSSIISLVGESREWGRCCSQDLLGPGCGAGSVAPGPMASWPGSVPSVQVPESQTLGVG